MGVDVRRTDGNGRALRYLLFSLSVVSINGVCPSADEPANLNVSDVQDDMFHRSASELLSASVIDYYTHHKQILCLYSCVYKYISSVTYISVFINIYLCFYNTRKMILNCYTTLNTFIVITDTIIFNFVYNKLLYSY